MHLFHFPFFFLFLFFQVLSNSLPKHPSQNIANLPNALSKQAHLKNQQQTQSLQHLLSQHKKDFNAPAGATANNVPIIHQDPVTRMLNSMNLPHQPNPANVLPVPTMPQSTTSQNNSFQSLMMQLHTMQKPHVLQQVIIRKRSLSLADNLKNLFIRFGLIYAANSTAPSTINHYECNEFVNIAT